MHIKGYHSHGQRAACLGWLDLQSLQALLLLLPQLPRQTRDLTSQENNGKIRQ